MSRVCPWRIMPIDRRRLWGRMASCGGLLTRPSLRRLPIGEQVTNLPHRGSALLAVLWLTAALSAIAFSVANTVRAETERTSTAVDSLRAYYLATGAINRAILHIEWGPGYRNADGTSMFGGQGQGPVTIMQFEFPSGSAVVKLIPETAKLNVNQSPPLQLMNLLVVLGTTPEQAQAIDRKSTRLNSSHLGISYAVFCLKKNMCIEIERRKVPPETDGTDSSATTPPG